MLHAEEKIGMEVTAILFLKLVMILVQCTKIDWKTREAFLSTCSISDF